MSKHTPGPWEWTVEDESMLRLCGPEDLFDWVLAVTPCEHCQRRTRESGEWNECLGPNTANARLIAAAPTMLSALRGIVAMGCWVPVGEGGTRCAFCNATNDSQHDADCAYVAAVNAKAEAEGTL